MNKLISGISAVAFLSLTALAGGVPASAEMTVNHSNFHQQDARIGTFCDRNPRASDCNDWRVNHTHWNNNQYQGFYRNHQRDRGFGGNAIATLFGLALAPLTIGAPNGSMSHIRACESAYRSYDHRSDTYLGFDGSRHLCRA